MIERQAGKTGADRCVAENHRHIFLGKMLADQVGQQLARARREFGHLDQCAVARREGRRKRRHGQQQRVIPGHDDADDAQRLRNDARPPGAEPDGSRAAPRFHPGTGVSAGMTNRLKTGEQFQQAGFVRRSMTEIGIDGGDEALGVGMYQGQQGVEPRLAALPVGDHAAATRGVHAFEHGAERRSACFLMCRRFQSIHHVLPVSAQQCLVSLIATSWID